MLIFSHRYILFIMSYRATNLIHYGEGERTEGGGWIITYSHTGVQQLADIFYQYAMYVPQVAIRHKDNLDEVYDISPIMKEGVQFMFNAIITDMNDNKRWQ